MIKNAELFVEAITTGKNASFVIGNGVCTLQIENGEPIVEILDPRDDEYGIYLYDDE